MSKERELLDQMAEFIRRRGLDAGGWNSKIATQLLRAYDALPPNGAADEAALLASGECKAILNSPEGLQVLIDWHDFQAGEAESIGYDEVELACDDRKRELQAMLNALPPAAVERQAAPFGYMSDYAYTANLGGVAGFPTVVEKKQRDDDVALYLAPPQVREPTFVTSQLMISDPEFPVVTHVYAKGKGWPIATSYRCESAEKARNLLEMLRTTAPAQGAEGFREPGIEDAKAVWMAFLNIPSEGSLGDNFEEILTAMKSAGCMFPEKAR